MLNSMLLRYFSLGYFYIIFIMVAYTLVTMTYVRGLFLFLCLSNTFIIIYSHANAENSTNIVNIANINAHLNTNNIDGSKNKNIQDIQSVKNIKIVADLRPIYFLVKDLIEGTPAELILIEEGEEALHGHGFALKPNEIYFIQKADLLVTYNDYKGENYKIAENKVILLNKPCLLAWLPLRDLISKASPVKQPNIQAAIENHNNNHNHEHLHGSSSTYTYEKLNHKLSSGYDNKHNEHSSNTSNNIRKDVHFWLDPQNALKTIEITNKKLKELDPLNAEIYQNNYENLQNKINAEIILIRKQLRSLTGEDSTQEEGAKQKYLVLHDAYQYFEKFFGIISPIGYFYDNNHNTVSFQSMNDYLNLMKNSTNNSKIAKGKEPVSPLNCIISNRKKDKLLESFNSQAKIKIIYLEPTGHDIDIKALENGYILLLRNMSSGFQQCFSQY